MTDILKIRKINEVYIKVGCDPGVAYELRDYCSFKVPGYKFMPTYRNRQWDGNIYLFNVLSCTIYSGLLYFIEQFAKEREYEIEYLSDFTQMEFSLKEANDFISTLNIPSHFEKRDYQVDTFVHAVRNLRALYESPTASGKSFIIYLLCRYFNLKTLIIVPTISLVSQMYTDFIDYGFDSENNVHKIFSGKEKNDSKQITVSTWQSIYKLPKEYFKQFRVVIGDEAHGFKSKSLISIMTKLEQCKLRFGFTGTLDGTQTHKLVLEGLFGPVKKVATTKELINQGHLSNFFIKSIILKHSQNNCNIMKKASYNDEINYLVSSKERNNFIKNLALSLEGNTLILFRLVDTHGKILYSLLQDECSDRKIYYVSGEVSGEERERIRLEIEKEKNAIIVASTVFTTGVNIKNLHNLIFSSPSKARIKTLQSIGRGLRKSDLKTHCTLFDIADDLSYKTHRNFTLNHFAERLKMYLSEEFPYKIYNVKLKE